MYLKQVFFSKYFLIIAAVVLFTYSCKKDAVAPVTTNIPVALKTANDEVLIASYFGVGTQNYEAQADPDHPGQAKWVFIEPVANLYDANGNLVILHSKGPDWKYIADGSSVTGITKVNIPSPVATQNISWLLLGNKANQGMGVLANVNFIQRLDTRGGVAPVEIPTTGMIGTTVKIPYTALYNFYKKK